MSQRGYLDITKVNIPYECISTAYDHLRSQGKNRLEGVALFAGKEENTSFTIVNTIIPRQKAMSLEDGLLYAVDGEELHLINVWLYENKMSLMVQIHSHPGRAYHSATDDSYPIVATRGGISIVVPDFAFGPIDVRTWAVFRLSELNEWLELNEDEKTNLLNVI